LEKPPIDLEIPLNPNVLLSDEDFNPQKLMEEAVKIEDFRE
jgi:hypothetical protein